MRSKPSAGSAGLSLKADRKGRLDETIQRAQRASGSAEHRCREPVAAPDAAADETPGERTPTAAFIVDAQDIVYATIEDGLITLVTSTMEGESNYKTIEDLQVNLDRTRSGGSTGRSGEYQPDSRK